MVSSLLLILAGCTDYELQKDLSGVGAAAPLIQVEPTALDFWDVGSDEEELRSFTIHSVGSGLLVLGEIVPPASADFLVIADVAGAELEPGESLTVDVAFTPTVRDPQADQLIVVSNDALEPNTPVTLAGAGRMPWLAIDPERHDFGAVPVGCAETAEFVLQNVGEEDLDVSEVSVTGDQSLTLVDDPGAFTLAPGQWTTVEVRLDVSGDGAVSGALEVTSNDARGTVTAPIVAEGEATDDVEETFTIEAEVPADVLFAVDQSCSMVEDQEALGANFADYVAAVEEVTTGWHAGVVTLDDACVNGGVIDASTDGGAALFAEGATVGEDEDIADDEALFQLVDRALAQTGAGECNEGLLRDGARLHVIVISDEPERSPEQASAWTWDWWVSDFQALSSDLVISGVVDLDDCGEGADGYLQAIEATGGEAASICSDDWAAHMAALAAATVDGLWRYELAGEPDPDTIVVTVDGVQVSGWTYEDGAVVFDGRPDGSEVVVSYAVMGECG